MSKFSRLLAVFVAVAAIPVGIAAQAAGTITGQVLDPSGQALPGAIVSVTGTQLRTATNAQGNYRLPNVPAGRQTVTATLIGRQTGTQTVTVAAGQTATATFRLSATAVALDEIVVTGTAGATTRREQPAVIATVDVAQITERGVVTSVRDVLTARVPGVSTTASSGTSGTAQQIRIRGASSISLSNEPLVFIDGVRADARAQAPFFTGGQAVSRLFDIDPEDIESIEVVKGPAAATLYGADASAGVIQIITKRGKTGSNRFTQRISTEYNHIDPNYTPPANFGTCTAALVAANSQSELCRGQSVGTIVQDNPLVREGAFRDGSLRSLGYSARGGGENYGYYLSLNLDQEDGTLPNNELDRRSGRFNFTFIPTPNISVEAGVGIFRTFVQLPDNDNNIYGFLGGGLLGRPTTVGATNNGFFAPNRNVAAIASIQNEVLTNRLTPSVQINYTPVSWFKNRLTLGADLSDTEGLRFFPRNEEGRFQGTTNTGSVLENRNNFDSYTFDYLGTMRGSFLNDRVTSDFSFGAQVINERTDILQGTGLGLTTNAARVVSAASQISAFQGFAQQKSVGFLAQEQLGFADRLFVQFGGRLDMNSSFGEEAEPFFLPKVGVSYVVSEEPFFERLTSVVPTLRLRAAYGTTGRSPNPGASLQTFDPAPFAITGGSGSGVVALNPGNFALRPERATEFEAGFEAGLFNNRIGLDLTYFRKRSSDLLVQRPLPPSAGFIQTGSDPFVNLGGALNEGLEYQVRGTLVDRPNFRWEARLAGSTLHNELLSLGEVDGIPIQPFGTTNRFTPGRPLGAFFTRRIRSVDQADNRVIVSDTIEFAGNILPTNEGNVGTTFTLFDNVQLTGQVDWKSGFKIFNSTAQFRERALRTAENTVVEDKLSREERMRRFGPFFDEQGNPVSFTQVNEAYIEDGDFVRLREVAATFGLPDRFARSFGATGVSFTIGGQNLGLWTDYTGADPEVISAVNNTGRFAFTRSEFLTVPSPRRLVAKLNLSF